MSNRDRLAVVPTDNSTRHDILRELQYVILPSKLPRDPEWAQVHNSVYTMWKTLWTDVFNKLKYDPSHLNDDFIRQDVIVGLMHKNEAVGAHLYTFFSMDSKASCDNRYFTSNFPPEYFTWLEKNKIRKVMTWEYLSVNPEWRSQRVGLSIGNIIIGLASKMLSVSNVDAAIAPARNDFKVSQMCYDVGAQPVISNIVNHNVSCDLLACKKQEVKPHTDTAIREYVDYYWTRRIDTLDFSNLNQNPMKHAA